MPLASLSLVASAHSCFAEPMTQDAPFAPTINLLQQRRSVPPVALGEPGPDPDQLAKILAIAARVPDHGKLAPWRFIIFRGEGRARAGEALARVFQALNPDAAPSRIDIERKRFSHAPVVVGLVSRAMPHVKIPEWEQQLSAGAVAMNLIVAANALGFGTSWLTEWFSYDREAQGALGLADHERSAGFIHIGRPTTTIEDRLRPVMADIVTVY